MRKLGLTFYCIILMLICQPLIASTPVNALSETQTTAISANCIAIKDDLKKIQQADSRARVYLGGYYEKIISKFVTPLNVRLVENNLSTAESVENQNQLTKTKANLVSHFIEYQRELETLIALDCKSHPDDFYTQLEKVRTMRQTVASDNTKVRSLISAHTDLVVIFEEKF